MVCVLVAWELIYFMLFKISAWLIFWWVAGYCKSNPGKQNLKYKCVRWKYLIIDMSMNLSCSLLSSCRLAWIINAYCSVQTGETVPLTLAVMRNIVPGWPAVVGEYFSLFPVLVQLSTLLGVRLPCPPHIPLSGGGQQCHVQKRGGLFSFLQSGPLCKCVCSGATNVFGFVFVCLFWGEVGQLATKVCLITTLTWQLKLQAVWLFHRVCSCLSSLCQKSMLQLWKIWNEEIKSCIQS